MNIHVGNSTPLLEVDEIESSIRFYELLGFSAVDTDREEPLGWARMHCEGGAVMFLRAGGPADASAQTVSLCMYTPDLAGLARVSIGQRSLRTADRIPGILAKRGHRN
jgi:hypothetical protein